LRFNASNQARDCGKAAQQDETDVIATEAMVAEVPKKNAGAGGMPPGGGGMGGRVAWASKSRPFRNPAIRKAWPFCRVFFAVASYANFVANSEPKNTTAKCARATGGVTVAEPAPELCAVSGLTFSPCSAHNWALPAREQVRGA
jgi:hypothetical protein